MLDYASAATVRTGIGILCYPSDQVELVKALPEDPNSKSNGLLIIGIPLRRSAIADSVTRITSELDILRAAIPH
jgi:hypothetical protein